MEITTGKFARQVALQFDGVTGALFEDNFFDMIRGQKKTVAILNAAGGRQLTVRALNAGPNVLAWEEE